MAGRAEKLRVAPPLQKSICEGWYSGWARPGGGVGFWANVWADLTRSVGAAIGRWANVTMVAASSMRGIDRLYFHKAPTDTAADEPARIITGDVFVVLLMSCSQEVTSTFF